MVSLTDVRDAKDAFPDCGDGSSGGGGGGDVGGASEAAGFGFDAEFFSEADTLGLAGGAFGDLVQEDDAAWDFEVREGLAGEVTERRFGNGGSGVEDVDFR